MRTTDQRLNRVDERLDKLASEIEVLRRVLESQNKATAALRHEWRMWSDELLRIHAPTEGVNASKWLASPVST